MKTTTSQSLKASFGSVCTETDSRKGKLQSKSSSLIPFIALICGSLSMSNKERVIFLLGNISLLQSFGMNR